MSPKAAASSKSSAAQPAEGKHLCLSQLNKASAKTGGTFLVSAYSPKEDKYEYTFKGKQRQGSNFVVTLVSAEDPSQYCQGHFKKTAKNEAKYEQIKKTIQEGKSFVMSKVAFVEDAKPQYVSASIKIVVDLSSTRMDVCLESPSSVVQPAPTATVAGSSALTGNQFFDLTALIQKVEDIKEHSNNRSSFVLKILDGSLDEEKKKIKVIPLRIYFDTLASNSAGQPVNGHEMKKLADEHLQSQTPMSFFCISGAKDEDEKFAFRNTKHTFITAAVGPKADELKKATELHNLSAEETVAFELQTSTQSRDWSAEPGKETRCALLTTFARTATGVVPLDWDETIWQLNWVRITEPSEGQNIKNQFGNLWLPLTCRDETGAITLYITEKAVLKLSNCVDAAEFEQLFKEGMLRLPFYASIKVQRRVSKLSAAQPDSSASYSNSMQEPQNDNDFDCFIVDAAPQDIQESLSSASMQLLSKISHSADSALPAALGMIQKSEHYAMAVEYVTQAVPAELTKVASKTTVGVKILRPCSRAVALVASTKRSKCESAGPGGGQKLVTENVIDLLADSAEQPAAQEKYELTSYCTLDNVTDFKLDPPKSAKEQAALISVTAVSSPESGSSDVKRLLVDDVQLLPPEEANAMKLLLNKQLYFAALAGQVSRNKRAREPWSPAENPADAAPCRSLGRSPTGPALPDYSPSPKKPAA